MASRLALPPWKGRSSEERPDGLFPVPTYASGGCKQQGPWKSRVGQELLLQPGLCQAPLPPRGWAGGMPGVAQGVLDARGTFPMAPPPGGPVGFGSIPWYRRGFQMWCPAPALCQAVPRAGGSPSVPPVVTVPSAGMHRSWAPGMKESARKTQTVGKNLNPPKIQTNPELLEQQGENLNFLGKSSSIC